jgi:hypothetical protein
MEWVSSIYFVGQKNGKLFNIGLPGEQTEHFKEKSPIKKNRRFPLMAIYNFFKLVIKEKLLFTAFEIREKNKRQMTPSEFMLLLRVQIRRAYQVYKIFLCKIWRR